jgi:hypothetical protein
MHEIRRRHVALLVGGVWLGTGCDPAGRGGSGGDAGIASFGDDGSGGDGSSASGGAEDGGDGTGSHDDGDGSDGHGDGHGDGPKFDLGSPDGGVPGGDEGGPTCSIPEHVPCDAGTSDPFAAIGIGCPGELDVATSSAGPATGRGVRSAFGSTATFDPREGSMFAVIGSGLVAELDQVTPTGDSDAFPTHCNDDLGAFDPGETLPAPLRVNDVGGDCAADPALVGTGDCSNTVQEQFTQGDSANDYVELRLQVTVPPDVVSFSYDFAFFSTEYPTYFGSGFNDMYVGWLESEAWTGNVSFDGEGNPISLNAGFLDFKDDGGNLPELAGTCMRQHAGTGWLTTTAGVVPGEDITIVFAIFDLSDSILDSYAFIDDFQWGCDPTDTPSTEPEG